MECVEEEGCIVYDSGISGHWVRAMLGGFFGWLVRMVVCVSHLKVYISERESKHTECIESSERKREGYPRHSRIRV
jgi:hypothetical protein